MPTPCKRRDDTGPGPGCTSSCPLERDEDIFHYVRVEKASDEPPMDARIVDVAILDMNYGMPNLGHDSLVNIVRAAACDFSDALREAGLAVRVISYDTRRSLQMPKAPGSRFQIFLGTGGPGHLDPRDNRGEDEYCQGVHESVEWEKPLFTLFDKILADKDAALLGICHTFGLMCRWSGAAKPQLRGAAKGHKSAGVLENLLTDEALAHPWFSQFSTRLDDGRRLRILDSRFFDLIPPETGLPRGFTAIGYETKGNGGARGESITMIEFKRTANETMPQVFAVNHHPEIMNRERQLALLYHKRANNHVTEEWFEERLKVLTAHYNSADGDRQVSLTSYFTLVAPMRFQLARALTRRAADNGRDLELSTSLIYHTCSMPAIC